MAIEPRDLHAIRRPTPRWLGCSSDHWLYSWDRLPPLNGSRGRAGSGELSSQRASRGRPRASCMGGANRVCCECPVLLWRGAPLVTIGVFLQFVLYAEPLGLRWFTADWFGMTLPRIVAIGFAISLVVGAITETGRLIGRPMLTSVVLGTYHRPTREQRIVM